MTDHLRLADDITPASPRKKELSTKPRVFVVGFVAGVGTVALLLPILKAAVAAILLPLILVILCYLAWKVIK